MAVEIKTLNYKMVLEDFLYKPNWACSAYEYEGEWWIRLVMLVENSRAPWQRWQLKPVPQEDMFYSDYTLLRMPRGPDFAGYSPSREVVEVVGSYPIPHFEEGEEDTFILWLVQAIKMMEEHEIDEWARYKGVLLNDPHKEDANV